LTIYFWFLPYSILVSYILLYNFAVVFCTFCINIFCNVIYTKTVCTSVGSTNVKLLCWVVILLPEKNKQKPDVSSESPSSRFSSRKGLRSKRRVSACFFSGGNITTQHSNL
jgi:hypothetical protein